MGLTLTTSGCKRVEYSFAGRIPIIDGYVAPLMLSCNDGEIKIWGRGNRARGNQSLQISLGASHIYESLHSHISVAHCFVTLSAR